jgi:CBS domain-containing protein
MRTVKNILKNKAVQYNTIEPNTLVIDALNELNTVDMSYLVVLEGDQYKGIFSERDYSRNVILKGRASKDTTVAEVMTTDLPIVNFSDTLEHCMNEMITKKARYLLAFDEDEKFAGVITIHDLLREIIANKEEAFDHATASRLIDHDEKGRIY